MPSVLLSYFAQQSFTIIYTYPAEPGLVLFKYTLGTLRRGFCTIELNGATDKDVPNIRSKSQTGKSSEARLQNALIVQ